METCRLTSYGDLEWALQQVQSGHTVLVVVPRPHASRREAARHLDKMHEYMIEARHDALVSGVRYGKVRRFLPGQYVSQFTLSPLHDAAEPILVLDPDDSFADREIDLDIDADIDEFVLDLSS